MLAGMSKSGTNISYTYDANGICTSKTVNGVTTNYTLMGDKVTHEVKGSDTIHYIYDGNGRPLSMFYNNTEYFYVYNALGDVIGLHNGSVISIGFVAEYSYDAWGNVLSVTGNLASTVGAANPYRYRGYRYDTETGLYYLQSRYYDPKVGRFINADGTGTLGAEQGNLMQYNLFAYCLNNPVNTQDQDGHLGTPLSWAMTAIMGVAGGLLGNYIANQGGIQVGKKLRLLQVVRQEAPF